MPEPGESTGIDQTVADKPTTLEVKNPNERLFLLADLTKRIVGNNLGILQQELKDIDGRLNANSRTKLIQQMEDLNVLLGLAAKIKNGDPFVPTELKSARIDPEGTTTLRLIKEGSKLKQADRGGQIILNLQYVKAQEGESSLDQAYSTGLRGKDPDKIRDPKFQSPAEHTIYVSSELAYLDPFNKVRSRPRAGFSLSYNQGENTGGHPTARVGAVIFSGETPYIAETNTKIFWTQFEQIKNVITSSHHTSNPQNGK